MSRKNPIQPRIEAFLNERPAVTLLSISCVYFLLTLSLASIKLLWLDELITFHIAKLGSMTAIWNALSAGADPNPPLTHILSLWSMRVFGDGAISFRLPAILAGWICVVCLFLFLRRRVPGLFAAAGVCIFMTTAAFDYSYEERSYALVLAFSSTSLLLWQRTLETKRSVLFPALLAIALAAGVSANYFAVLAFFPISAGQLVYDVQRRRMQWRVWTALLFGGLPFFAYLPLINHAIAKYTPYAWNKVGFSAVANSYLQMVESMLWLGLAMLVAASLSWLRARRSGVPAGPAVLPRHEGVAVFLVMAYPFIAYAIARVRGGMLSPRFVLPVATGFAMASSVAAFRLFQRRPAARIVFVSALALCVLVRESVVGYRYHAQKLAFYRVIERLPAADRIVVSDSLLVLPLQRYAPQEISSRIVFPIDFAAIRKYKREDSPEQNLFAGKAVFPVALVSLDQVKGQLSHSLIVSTRDNWLVHAMRDQGLKLRELPIATESEDIAGFTPLCHGPVVYFSSLRAASHFSAKQETMTAKPVPDDKPHAKP